MDTPSSSSNPESVPQKRLLPSRNRRYVGGAKGSEVDKVIMEANKTKALADGEYLNEARQAVHLTSDGAYAESGGDTGRVVNTIACLQYYSRPEVIESYRQQQIIMTPVFVSLKDDPSHVPGSRFRPRDIDKTIGDFSDEAYFKRHKKFDASEKRVRIRELETLKNEHNKLKARIEQLKAMDSLSFLTFPAESFSLPPATAPRNHAMPGVVAAHPEEEEEEEEEEEGEDARISEGERRRREMLEGASLLDERYRTLLPPDYNKSTKKTTKQTAPPIIGHPVEPAEEDREESIPAAPPKEVVERPRFPVPFRSTTSTTSASAPSPASFQPDTSAPAPRRRGRPSKNGSLVSFKGKKPVMPPRPPTPSPPPSPTSSPPASSRAPSVTETNETTAGVSDLQTPLLRVISGARPSVARSTSPFLTESTPESGGEEVGRTFGLRPRKRVKSVAAQLSRNLSPPRAPSLPPIESISTAPARSPSVQASVALSTKKGRALKTDKPSIIMQVARRCISTRDRAPRHLTAFGVKLPPAMMSTAPMVDYELPSWILEPEEDPPTVWTMTGRLPDGGDSDEDEDEPYDPPPLLPKRAETPPVPMSLQTGPGRRKRRLVLKEPEVLEQPFYIYRDYDSNHGDSTDDEFEDDDDRMQEYPWTLSL